MSPSSFDARISQREFDKQITLTLSENKSLSVELKRNFIDRLDRETATAKNKFWAKSPQYAQFLRSTLEFANRYSADMTNLDAAFDVLRTKAVESVWAEQDRVENSTKADFENPSLFRTDIRVARAMNPVSMQKIFTGAEWEFQAYSPEERKVIGAKSFNIGSAQSWKETSFLLGAEFANSIKDIAFFFTSIPGSISLLPRFAYLRANRHESLENEAMLAQMLKEFPALALVDLASDGDKAIMVLKEVASKLASGKQEDIAFSIVNVIGLLAGGALLAGKLGGSAAKLARLASSGATRAAGKMAQVASSSTNTAVRVGARVAEAGARWVAVGTLATAGFATAGEVALSRVASVAGGIDMAVSGQFAVNAAAGKIAKMAGASGVSEGNLSQKGRMTKAQSLEIARANTNISPLERVRGVETLLNTQLSSAQSTALEKAHNIQAVDSKGIGQFSIGELRAKARILQEEGGFTGEQTRAIMENGYAGKMGDRASAVIQKGKLIFKQAREALGRAFAPERVWKSQNGTENIRIGSSIKNEGGSLSEGQIASPKTQAKDVAFRDIWAKEPSVESAISISPEGIVDQVKVLESEFLRTPNRSEARIANLEKYEANIRDQIAKQWAVKSLWEVDLLSFLNERRKDLPKPKITEIEKGKRYNFVPASPVKMDELSALLFRERGLQIILKDCAPGNTRYMADLMRTQTAINDITTWILENSRKLKEAAQKATEAKTIYNNTYQVFSQAFQNSNTLTYRVSSVDGKPFVEIQNTKTWEWSPATPKNTTAMWGQTLESFNDRIWNEFKALLLKQKNTALANPNTEKLQNSLAQVQRLLAKERARLTPEIKMDIIDAVNNGERSKNAQRIKDIWLNPSEIDKIIQDAAAEANRLTTVDQTRAALVEMTKNGKGNFLLTDNIKYEALRARTEKLSREGLVVLGEDPNKIVALTKTPEGRATLAKDLEKTKKENASRWWLLLPLILALGWCSSQNGDGSGSNGGSGPNGATPPVAPPTADPTKPIAPQIDTACGADSRKALGEFQDKRISNAGATLTIKTRDAIGRRWMKTAEWKDLVTLAEISEPSLAQEFTELFNRVKATPSAQNVQELQRWIGMENEDSDTAQDGILGPNTTRAINDFIARCTDKKSGSPSSVPPTAQPIPGQTAVAPPSDGNNGTIPAGQPDTATPTPMADPMGYSLPGV
jgi:peptidoglycan hydrolase-like protein with peptidoglycan-binding domain